MPLDPAIGRRAWMGLCLALACCGDVTSGHLDTGADAALAKLDANAGATGGSESDAAADASSGLPDGVAVPDAVLASDAIGPRDASAPVDGLDGPPDAVPPDGAPADAGPPPAPPTLPGGPVAVTPQDPAEATAERVLEGPVDFAAAPRDDQLLASGPDGIRLWRTAGQADVGAPRTLTAVLSWDTETLLVGGPDGLAVVTPEGVADSPLNEQLAAGVTGLAPGPEGVEAADLWIATERGLYRWQAGALARAVIGELPTEGARLVASPRGVWVAADRAVYRLGLADGALRAYVVASNLAADAMAADADDNLWIVSEGDLHQRAPGGRVTIWRLPAFVLDVAAHPAAHDVWAMTADGLWHVRDGVFRALLGLPAVRAVACAPAGDAVIGAETGLYRVLPGRHVLLTPSFDAVNQALGEVGSLDIVPAFPERVVSVSTVLDGRAPETLAGPPWRLPLDGESLAEAPHVVDVTVAWNDAAPVSARFEFRVDRPDPPPPPPTAPPTMAPTAPPPPGYAADIAPLFDLRCGQCHGPRGFAHRMDGYARFTAEFEAVMAVVTDGRMPLPPNPRLTPAQLELLSDWREAGFPE